MSFPSPQEAPRAWLERTARTLREAHQREQRAGPGERRAAETALLDAVEAHQEAQERTAGFADAGDAAWIRPLSCGHATDRQCLSCGWHFCAGCQPDGGGAACQRCAGPVYLNEEPRPRGLPNPEMGTY